MLLYSPHSAFILWGNLCRGLVQKKLEQLVESELLKITKYHTTTKIGSPKLNCNFFFILQHNVIVFILLQSTADIVHLAKVTTVFCGAYIPIIPIISATDFWRYVSLLLYSQWWSQCCSFSWKDVQFSAQDIVRSGLGDVGSCGDGIGNLHDLHPRLREQNLDTNCDIDKKST